MIMKLLFLDTVFVVSFRHNLTRTELGSNCCSVLASYGGRDEATASLVGLPQFPRRQPLKSSFLLVKSENSTGHLGIWATRW